MIAKGLHLPKTMFLYLSVFHVSCLTQLCGRVYYCQWPGTLSISLLLSILRPKALLCSQLVFGTSSGQQLSYLYSFCIFQRPASLLFLKAFKHGGRHIQTLDSSFSAVPAPIFLLIKAHPKAFVEIKKTRYSKYLISQNFSEKSRAFVSNNVSEFFRK